MEISDLVFNLDPTTLAILTFFGIGLATLADKLNEPDWRSVRKIAICVVGLGLLSLAVPGVTVVQGMAIGLAASGLLTGVSFIAKKSGTPEDLTITDKPVVSES